MVFYVALELGTRKDKGLEDLAFSNYGQGTVCGQRTNAMLNAVAWNDKSLQQSQQHSRREYFESVDELPM